MKNEKNIIIHELQAMNVQHGSSGQSLHEMDYQSLVRLLAVKRAVVS